MKDVMLYFTKEQRDAIDGKIVMTQAIFNSIQRRRLIIGSKLECVAQAVFCRYDNMAAVYLTELQCTLDALQDVDVEDREEELQLYLQQ